MINNILFKISIYAIKLSTLIVFLDRLLRSRFNFSKIVLAGSQMMK